MTVVANGKRYPQCKWVQEKDFEDEIVASSKILFGQKTIYINAKKKVDSKLLGSAVPDGFFFDFGDPSDPQFYVVEVELSTHSFFNHIFPQVTKFFAFFKNPKLQKSLVDKLFSVINTDDAIREEFKKHLGQTEIYKFLSDIVESSQNILLIADEPIVELPEIAYTYTDTWGKMVKYLEIRKYQHGQDTVFTMTPDYETLQYEGGVVEHDEDADDEEPKSSEASHLENATPGCVDVYNQIKAVAAAVDDRLVFNPQKYYISIIAEKNIAFMEVRKKKIRLIAMLPEDRIRKCIKSYAISSLSDSVQGFYNGPCAAVHIANAEHMSEIDCLLREMIEYNKADA